MNINEWLRLIAGTVVLVSIILAVTTSSYWLLLTGFVAINLIQSAFTKWCPMMSILKRLHVREV
ncbi:YgaP family membrane protein [Aurantivibrio infirmus]